MSSRLRFFLASLTLCALIASGALALAVSEPRQGEDSLYKHLSVFSEVLSLIRRTYVDQTELDQLFAGALDGTTDALDSHAVYVPADRVEAFQASREIGISRSGVSLIKERGIAYVLAVVDGSPGQAAELETGDIVAEIDGRSTRGTALWELRSLLADEPGTELELSLLRQGRRVEATLTLAAFDWPAPSLVRHQEIPVIDPGRLDAANVAAVRGMLSGLADERMVVDLRGLAGGEPEAAYDLAALFAQGELGSLKARDEVVARFSADNEPVWSGRLVVLTDRGTQGAAEVAAAALAQAAGAELVGQRTFGFAGRERVVELTTGARLALADAFYTGPDGELLSTSLEPEVAVTEISRRLGESGVPLSELILRRGLERVLGDDEPADRQAA